MAPGRFRCGLFAGLFLGRFAGPGLRPCGSSQPRQQALDHNQPLLGQERHRVACVLQLGRRNRAAVEPRGVQVDQLGILAARGSQLRQRFRAQQLCRAVDESNHRGTFN